jgi:glycosyltransferase involved in cell wall biosynthesis
MPEPKVTVLIDTYNYGHFIEEAIDSVLSQEFPKERMEILVVDDGSTDDTADRVKKYGSKIQYFRKENGGQASAFNFGFSHSRGDIICFLDADDYWLPNKLRRVVEAFENGPAGMVSNGYELSAPGLDRSMKPNVNFVSGDISNDLESLLRYRIFPTSCLAFRRETLKRLMPIPEAIRLQADAFLVLLVVFIAPVSALPETLTIYRIHGNNLFSAGAVQRTPKSQRRIHLMWKIIFSEMRAWLRRNGFDPQACAIRTFLDQWELYQQIAEFAVIPPTRLQWFFHLLHYNRTYRTRQNWKLTVLNYLSAMATLVWGYKMPRPQQMPPEGGHHA